jgi:cysteine desulfurase/selenocysteine lyase
VIEVLPETPAGDVDLGALAAALARPGAGRAALVSLTHAPTSSGRVYDAEGVGAVLARHWAAAEAGAEAAGGERKRRRGGGGRGREDISDAAAARSPPLPAYVVDGCQSVGQLAVDARALRCDFLSATGRKFLRAPRGSGFLYASPRALRLAGCEPTLADNVGAEWTAINSYTLAAGARRYESYELSVAAKLGLGVAVRELLAAGPARVFCRIAALGAELRALLEEIPGVRVLDRGARLGGIVSCAVAGAPADAVVAALRARGVNASVSAAASTRLDFEARSLTEIVRLSPHAFNTSEELAAAAAVVARVAAEAGA